MATEKPRFTVTFEPDVLKMLDHYWRVHDIRNRNEAINQLLRAAMSDDESLNVDEQRLIEEYRASEYIAKAMVHSALKTGIQYTKDAMIQNVINKTRTPAASEDDAGVSNEAT